MAYISKLPTIVDGSQWSNPNSYLHYTHGQEQRQSNVPLLPVSTQLPLYSTLVQSKALKQGTVTPTLG